MTRSKKPNNSTTLDGMYVFLKKYLLLVDAYLEDDISWIIKACRLRPYDLVFDKKRLSPILYTNWFDEFRGILKIQEDKTIKIYYNDITIDYTKIYISDIYHGLSLDKVVKISDLFYLFTGEINSEEFYVISFLGIDNYLRTYIYDGEWKKTSSLMLGLSNLKFIFKNKNMDEFKKLSRNYNIEMPCVSPQSWLSCLPVDEQLLKILEKKHGALFSFLK